MKSNIKKMGMFLGLLITFLTSSAYDFKVDGIYYTVTSFTDMTCEVASGDEKYSGDVNIPAEVSYNSRRLTVTSIGYKAFYKCNGLTSVSIPNSVTSIGIEAFHGCSGLTSVSIPNSVTSIDWGAFENCSGLISVTIGNSVTSIDIEAFYGCSGLTSVTIPNSVTSIGSRAFCDCSGLTEVKIGDSVTSIGQGALSGCSGLTSITIPNSVTSIGKDAFKNCSGLTEVKIGDSVTSIGNGAFKSCSSLTEIAIPNSVNDFGEYAFQDCTSLKSVSLSNALTKIPLGLFHGCSMLESLEIPGSVVNIINNYNNGYETFFGCDNLYKLRLSYGSEELRGVRSYWTNNIRELYIDRVLDDYPEFENLEKLEIGNSVKYVQVSKMSQLQGLKSIYSYALVPPTLPTMSNKQYMDVMVYVPEEAIEAYKNAESWKNFWNINPIPGSGASINDVEVDSNIPARIYNLGGIEMTDKESLPSGIYIERKGIKVRKIVVK